MMPIKNNKITREYRSGSKNREVITHAWHGLSDAPRTGMGCRLMMDARRDDADHRMDATLLINKG